MKKRGKNTELKRFYMDRVWVQYIITYCILLWAFGQFYNIIRVYDVDLCEIYQVRFAGIYPVIML